MQNSATGEKLSDKTIASYLLWGLGGHVALDGDAYTYSVRVLKGDLFYAPVNFAASSGARISVDVQFLVNYRGDYRH